MTSRLGLILPLSLIPCLPLSAGVTFNTNVTPDVIFGSGNANGGFAVDTFTLADANAAIAAGENPGGAGIELGLRGKLRFDPADDLPKNVFTNNGANVYFMPIGAPASNPDRARWNFEWSINTNTDGNGLVLDDLTYVLGIDFDPGIGATFLEFDPINVPFADHAIGTNATGNGDGVSAADPAAYASLISSNNVAQNSWNLAFFDAPVSPFSFDPNQPGVYDFFLEAWDGDFRMARTEIRVLAPIPEPSTIIGGASVLLIGLTLIRRRLRSRRS